MIDHGSPSTLPLFARARLAGLAMLLLLVSACILQQSTARPNPGGTRPPAPSPSQASREPAARALAPKEAARLQRVMGSLIRAMDHPLSLDRVRVGIADDPHVNAASAGGGRFLVTTGLLRKANDVQLAGVLGHELAHDDLGHVAKAQALGAGLDIGMVLLDRLLPGSGQLTPIAGGLIARAYSRSEEYVADRHGVTILTRAGYPAATMRNTLIWLAQTEGESAGGFFSTHPASGERIEALRAPR